MISDEGGRSIWEADYYAFGQQFATSLRDGRFNYGFTGKEFDPESGLNYHGARFLDPEIGRFLQVDPLSVKYPAESPYHYCSNNPMIYVDPDGKEIQAKQKSIQDAIKNTLPENIRKFVTFDKSGKLDTKKLSNNSDKSNDINLEALIKLAESETIFVITEAVSFEMKDNNGNISTKEFGKTTFNKQNEEEGFVGISLEDQSNTLGKNHFQITINKNIISNKKKLTTLSHELYGHAQLYNAGEDWRHKVEMKFKNSEIVAVDNNKKLQKLIKTHIKQSIINMKGSK